MKNTDNKVIAAANNSQIRGAVSKKVHRHQHGFVLEAQAAQNVVEVDVASRVLSVCSDDASGEKLDACVPRHACDARSKLGASR